MALIKTEVVIPSLGADFKEATLIKLHKQTGDAVKTDETIGEISTGSIESTVKATANGTLIELYYSEGDIIPADHVLCTIEGEEEAKPQIPVMITKDMKQQLADLGYQRPDIKAMTPQQAHETITAQKPKFTAEEIAEMEKVRKEKAQRNIAVTNIKNLRRYIEQNTDMPEEKVYECYTKHEKYRAKAGFNDLVNEREPVTLTHANLLVYLDRPDAFFLSRSNAPQSNEPPQNEPQSQAQKQEQQPQEQPPQNQPKPQPKKGTAKNHSLWQKLGIKQK